MAPEWVGAIGLMALIVAILISPSDYTGGALVVAGLSVAALFALEWRRD